MTLHRWASPTTSSSPKAAAERAPLEKLATQFLAANLYAHHAHLLAKGSTFMEDHEHFGDLYAAYDTAYDAVIELFIGSNGNPDLVSLTKAAADTVVEVESNEASFKRLLEMEHAVQIQVKVCMGSADDGTQGLLQQLAYESKQRVYKIQRRLN